MFGAGLDLCFNGGFLQEHMDLIPNGVHVLLAIHAPDCHLIRQQLVFVWVNVTERQIFQLPLNLPNPEPAGQRCEYFDGFERYSLAPLRRQMG